MCKTVFFFIFLMPFSGAFADSIYLRKITDTLSSRAFAGRGYVANGMQTAADFIAHEMKGIGLKTQKQNFNYPVNSFPGKLELRLNDILLIPGKDYIISAESKACNSLGELAQIDSVTFINRQEKIIVKIVEKLTWSVAASRADYTLFQVLKTAVKVPLYFKAVVETNWIKNFGASNIIGSIEGTEHSDSCIVFTAHYDHLGMMGSQTIFPGANDNASGVALLLDLAKYYINHPPKYSVVFIAFAGEEAGLLGSSFFVNYPLIKLNNIRFLINLDLMGNGDEGITIVNATEFPAAFETMQKINDSKHLLKGVFGRGKAANSDHYWFSENGVPAFFIYTMGKRKAYHDVDDVSNTLPWFAGQNIEQLIIDFTAEIIKGCRKFSVH